jgi:DNA-binding MarR family transcriptional regulator
MLLKGSPAGPFPAIVRDRRKFRTESRANKQLSFRFSADIMSIGPSRREQIDRFLIDEIDSIPQLEALLLLWRDRSRDWSREEIAKSLYISPEDARAVLRHLEQHNLVREVEFDTARYALVLESQERRDMLADMAEVYRYELVRVTNLIHGKASRAVRDFASAFRFKKDERK